MNMQTELDTTRPFSRCFSGGGEVSPIDRPVGYYQHGLYFGHDRKLLVEHPYNAEKLSLMKKLGLNPDEPKEVMLSEAQIERKPVNPEVQAMLETKTDEELAAMADKLVAELAAREIDAEAPTERGALIRFIGEAVS